MYYEILEKVFQENDYLNSNSKNILDLLDDFIRTELKNNYTYMNPYKLSYIYDFTVKESVQIFLFYTAPDKLFKITYFVDCPSCSSQPLCFNSADEFDNIYCEECRNMYTIDSLKEKVYVLFSLNKEITIPDNKLTFSGYNPNSTYDVLLNSSDEIKKDYPLSSNYRESKDRGIADSLKLMSVDEFNKIKNKPINESLDNLANFVFRKQPTV